jgi:hypothetical protein
VNSTRLLVLGLLSVGGAIAISSAGCNMILSNEEGTPLINDAGAIDSGGQQSPPPGTPDSDAATLQTRSCDTTQGNKVCFGLCVTIDQPNTGCGGESCDACDPKNANGVSCKGAGNSLSCAFDTCKDGFDNCDTVLANGCEAALNKAEHCGSCTKACAPGQVCGPTNGSYDCISDCPQETTKCGTSCVNTTNDTTNCGSCGTVCARDKAVASCNNGTCDYKCIDGFHDCSGTCVSNINPKACGPSCVACSAGGANTHPLCIGGGCSVECDKGWLDCDGDPRNGCEQQGTDPATECKTPCGKGSCAATECCANAVCYPKGTKYCGLIGF